MGVENQLYKVHKKFYVGQLQRPAGKLRSKM